MLAALITALPFLAPLLKTGSLQAAKWIAGAILLLTACLFSGYVGYHWSDSKFADYKASAAIEQKRIQDGYDQIGRETAAKYEAQREASEAETQRQLQELHSGPQSARVDQGRGHRRGYPRSGSEPDVPDSARIIGVLRSAAGK